MRTAGSFAICWWSGRGSGSRLRTHGRSRRPITARRSAASVPACRTTPGRWRASGRGCPGSIERQRDLPRRRAADLLGSDPSFHNWPFGEWLIEESQNLADSDPGRAGELAATPC